MADPTSYPALAHPHIRLAGTVDYDMYRQFQAGLASAPADGPLVVSITTLGGDPEVARAMGEDIRLMGAYHQRDAIFLGKVAVYSAGATFMSYFRRENRFLTRGTRIMVHERLITKDVHLEGPLRMCVATLKAALHEIEHSILIEEKASGCSSTSPKSRSKRCAITPRKTGISRPRKPASSAWCWT
jgi:hypothetical protein